MASGHSTCLAKGRAHFSHRVGAASSPCGHDARHQSLHHHTWVPSFCLQVINCMSNQHAAGVQHTRADAPSWGRALASAGFVNLCWQPLGYALYNRPIKTKTKNHEKAACCRGSTRKNAVMTATLGHPSGRVLLDVGRESMLSCQSPGDSCCSTHHAEQGNVRP